MQKTHYTKDKAFRFTFRVNETLYNWVQRKADTLGVTPCDYVRSVIFNQMAAEDFLRSTNEPNTDKKSDRCRDCEAVNENAEEHI